MTESRRRDREAIQIRPHLIQVGSTDDPSAHASWLSLTLGSDLSLRAKGPIFCRFLLDSYFGFGLMSTMMILGTPFLAVPTLPPVPS